MKITVRLFARAKDIAGAEAVAIEVGDTATVVDLRRALAKTFPAMTGLLERSAFAVDSEFANDATVVGADAEVALLPPVSGG